MPSSKRTCTGDTSDVSDLESRPDVPSGPPGTWPRVASRRAAPPADAMDLWQVRDSIEQEKSALADRLAAMTSQPLNDEPSPGSETSDARLAQELQQLVEQSDESPRDEKMVRRHHKTANKPRSRRARPPAPPPPPPRRAAAHPTSRSHTPPLLHCPSQVEAILQALQQDVEAAGQIGVPTAGGSGSGGHASPLGAAPFGGVEEYDEEERYRSVPPSQQAGIARLRRSLSAPGPSGKNNGCATRRSSRRVRWWRASAPTTSRPTCARR